MVEVQEQVEAPAELPPELRPPSMTVSAEERAARLSKMGEWKRRFAAMPKVVVRLREDETVMINGYGFHIKGGVRVEVPELVAEVLEQSGLI